MSEMQFEAKLGVFWHKMTGNRCSIPFIGYYLTHIYSVDMIVELIFNIHSITDHNECLTDSHGCHTNASCVNLEGTHQCKCRDGFAGNGTYCSGISFTYIFILVIVC